MSLFHLVARTSRMTQNRQSLKKICLASLAAVCAQSISGGTAHADESWIQPAGGSWENPANWSLNYVPNGVVLDFNLSIGSPYTVTMGANESPEQLNVVDSSVVVSANTGNNLGMNESIHVNASAGKIASFTFNGTSVDGTDGSTIAASNLVRGELGSVGGAGSTFFTLNNTSFTNYLEPITFGIGSTVAINNSLVFAGMAINGAGTFNASTVQVDAVVHGVGIGVSGTTAPATLNLSNGSVLMMSTSYLAIGNTAVDILNTAGVGIVNANSSQITNVTVIDIGSTGGTGTLILTNGSQATAQEIAVAATISSGLIATGTGTMNVSGSVATATQLYAVGSSGTVNLTAGGKIITPAFNLSQGSVLAITLDDPAAIAVSGQALFAGTLNVTLGAAPDPTRGQVFELFTFGTETSTFSTISLPPLDFGLSWSTQNLYTNGTIAVVTAAAPEPASLSLISLATLALLRRRRKDKI